jgi:hypothetical protein
MAASVAWGHLDRSARAQAVSPALSESNWEKVPHHPDYPQMTYFLVDSIEQHDAVVAQQTEIPEAHPIAGGDKEWFAVLLARTWEEETDARDLIHETRQEWARCCPSSAVRIIDLRTTTEPGKALPTH